MTQRFALSLLCCFAFVFSGPSLACASADANGTAILLHQTDGVAPRVDASDQAFPCEWKAAPSQGRHGGTHSPKLHSKRACRVGKTAFSSTADFGLLSPIACRLDSPDMGPRLIADQRRELLMRSGYSQLFQKQ